MTDSHPYTFCLSNEECQNSLSDRDTENHSIKLCEVGEMNSFSDLNEDYTLESTIVTEFCCLNPCSHTYLHVYTSVSRIIACMVWG